MSTLRVNNITDNSGGTNNLNVPGTARAWVNFNGTGTVAMRASFNVSSITDNGTGDYTVNFTTALADANYAASATQGGTAAVISIRTVEDIEARTTTSVRIRIFNTSNAVADVAQVSVAIFR